MSDMRGFWCSGDSTSQRILDVLESFYLRLWKIIVRHGLMSNLTKTERLTRYSPAFTVQLYGLLSHFQIVRGIRRCI